MNQISSTFPLEKNHDLTLTPKNGKWSIAQRRTPSSFSLYLLSKKRKENLSQTLFPDLTNEK